MINTWLVQEAAKAEYERKLADLKVGLLSVVEEFISERQTEIDEALLHHDTDALAEIKHCIESDIETYCA